GVDSHSHSRYEPMLATLGDRVPSGDGWLFEVKWDGYRSVAYLKGGEATLVSRNGNDLTTRFATVAKALGQAVKTPACVLAGEVCVQEEQGGPSFGARQGGNRGPPIVYESCHPREIGGRPLADLPLRERRKQLERLVDRRNTTVKLSESFADGQALFDAARKQ